LEPIVSLLRAAQKAVIHIRQYPNQNDTIEITALGISEDGELSLSIDCECSLLFFFEREHYLCNKSSFDKSVFIPRDGRAYICFAYEIQTIE